MSARTYVLLAVLLFQVDAKESPSKVEARNTVQTVFATRGIGNVLN